MADPEAAAPDPDTDPAAPEATMPQPERIAGALVTRSRGDEILHPTREAYLETARSLYDDGFGMCVDLTAVDYLERPLRLLPPSIEPERYEVVANLLSMDPPRRLRLRVQVPEADPTTASLWPIYPGVEAAEREAFDLFGIRFEGHPDLTRILMPEDWEGHPLRKDYAIGRIPVQFKAATSTR